jgi:hypothetical protein
MKAPQSHQIPMCSKCLSNESVQRNADGQWFCVACANDWLRSYVEAKSGHLSKGGVQLPYGAHDERKDTPDFRDLMPNRKARRRMK